MSELTIDSVRIGDGTDAFVIAEIGHNHQGSVETAKDLIRKAHAAGANAVKLQKRDNRTLYTREMYDSPYVNPNSYGATYGEHREALEFGREEFLELKAMTSELGIAFFATPFDFRSVDFLEEIGVPAYKTASADLTNTPLLEYIARLGKPMLVSTGGASLDDVRRAHDTIRPLNDQLCLLQCTAAYPVQPGDMNLSVLESYRREFPGAVLGLSDHQSGIAMSLVAWVLGARVFEKHFTLNRALKGTDHAFSLEPQGLAKLVRDLRRAAASLGDGEKRILEIERSAITKMGKKIVAAEGLEEGRVLVREDLTFKSPGDGLPPYEIERVLGRRLLRSLAADEALSIEDLAD
jgi:N-acetylneuraminate synthase/sialic acid synthase